jgi:hypothetical protein
MIIDCISDLPPHYCLSIQHNEHKATYTSINDYLNEDYVKECISYEEAHLCLQKDEIWEVQLYPNTPIGFYKTCASTLREAIRLMLMNYKNGSWN